LVVHLLHPSYILNKHRKGFNESYVETQSARSLSRDPYTGARTAHGYPYSFV